ncbi:hypothetical protein AHF37_12802 [Paragonimus kellicotti]|nr:hypothetical protein AHF37_12802 [Paragonimus kellicotti]
MDASNRFDRRLKGESGELPRADFVGIPWSQYFDLPSLSQVLPVLEFSDFLRSNPLRRVSSVKLTSCTSENLNAVPVHHGQTT